MIVRKPLDKEKNTHAHIPNRIFVRMALVIVALVVRVVRVRAFFLPFVSLFLPPAPPPTISYSHSLELLRATICNYNLVEK